jgi:hypothetical protein
MAMYEKTINAITQMALIQPEMSWRRNRSAKTVINNQNHTMKKNTPMRSIKKFRYVKPSCKKNIEILLCAPQLPETPPALSGSQQSRRRK